VESYSLDPLLLQTIPADTEIHKVKAYDVKRTRKLGLGSLSMRSYFQIRKKGNELLRKRKFDLVYFSTTAFHVMALGPVWKRKFNVPFILDIQDPWRNDFYLSKPKAERPPKFFIAYNIDKYLEAKTVPHADGIISVSRGYCETFKQRYPSLQEKQFRVIPFGASVYDFEVMEKNVKDIGVKLPAGKVNLVYVGRGGHDMRYALEIIFEAFRKGLEQDAAIFSNMHFTFVGTSYAPAGQGKKTIEPIAALHHVADHVTEITDRIPYFDTLYLLKKADILIVPGSTDKTYTASKIYPYLLADKPVVAVFYKDSSVVEVMRAIKAEGLITFNDVGDRADIVDACYFKLKAIIKEGGKGNITNRNAFEPYMALARTKEQVNFFEEVIERKGMK
jgi:glycosyltransferase involved in cell wall biosynthesis